MKCRVIFLLVALLALSACSTTSTTPDRAKINNSVLAVTIQNGQVNVPASGLVAYQPIAFNINGGKCYQNVTLMTADNHRRKLKACYQDYTLYLDPNPSDPSKAKGSIQLSYIPIWKRGFTYPGVSSTGPTGLTNVDISIHEIASNDNS